jgi:UDPglucose 6-dehydrogenase
LKPHVRIAESAEDACKDAEAIVICTEWDEFKELDWEKSKFGAVGIRDHAANVAVYANCPRPAFVFE